MNSLVIKLRKLSLVIVQTGRYMQKTKTSCQNYFRLYNTSWSKLQTKVFRMRDYANGSIQTIWMIFYDHIKQVNFAATKLFQLWTYFDHQDFWFELLTRGSRSSKNSDWLHDLVRQKIRFKKVMKKLLIYFLIESHQDTKSYSMHSIVHDWCTKSISRDKVDLTKLVLMMIELAVSEQSKSEYWMIQQRLFSHANRCVQQYHSAEQYDKTNDEEFSDAFHNLNRLYKDQSKLTETKKMYQRTLNEKKKTWGSNHTSTLDIVNNLSIFYVDQSKLTEAKKIYQRTLNEKKKAWDSDHTSTFRIVNNLNFFYVDQGKLTEAKKMYQRALNEYEKAWNFNHSFILRTVNDLRLLNASREEHMKTKNIHSQTLEKNDETHSIDQYSQSLSSTTKTVLHKFKTSMRKRKKDITKQWTNFEHTQSQTFEKFSWNESDENHEKNAERETFFHVNQHA